MFIGRSLTTAAYSGSIILVSAFMPQHKGKLLLTLIKLVKPYGLLLLVYKSGAISSQPVQNKRIFM
jgi:hypothetical protein